LIRKKTKKSIFSVKHPCKHGCADSCLPTCCKQVCTCWQASASSPTACLYGKAKTFKKQHRILFSWKLSGHG